MAVKCKDLVYTQINALSFKISGATHLLTPNKKDGIIQSLEGPDGLMFPLGLTLEIKKRKYKVNLIKEILINKVNYYTVSIDKRTKSSTFVMPMLGGHRDLYFWNKLFINCFIATEALSKFKNFRRRYDPNPDYVMFVFDVPNKHIKNYKNFINGKYSKFSSDYKFDVLEFHDKELDNELGQILFKSEKRKKEMEHKLDITLPKNSELLSIIDIEQETYNPEIYKFKKLI